MRCNYIALRSSDIFESKKINVILTWLGGLLGIPIAVFTLILLALYFQSPAEFEKLRTTYSNLAASTGKKAPDFVFSLLFTNEERKLSDYRGQLLLVNVWATWCVPCLKEMPDLNTLQMKYKNDGLVVIHLSDESVQEIKDYLEQRPMTTTRGRVERESVPEFYQFGGARPATFLISTAGEIIETMIGAKDLAYFERAVKANL